MALHVNLYHEIQQRQRAKKRDPLKLGMYGLTVVIMGFVAYYFVRLAQVSEITNRLGSVETEWQEVEPQMKAAVAREAELRANILLSENLVKGIEGRFYWGPVLERLMQMVPRQVQITRLEASRVPDKEKDYVLTVNGISTGVEPRQTAEDLRTALEERLAGENDKVTSSFKQLEETGEKVQFGGRALPTATFSIQIALAHIDPTPKREAKTP